MSEVFRRKETKYEIDREDYDHLRRAVARHLPLFSFKPDRPYTFVSTVYFDTETLAFFRRARRFYDDSVKLRIKEYYYQPDPDGPPEVFPSCFVEIKERTRGEVYKRRIRVPKTLIGPLFERRDIWPQLVASDPGIEFQDTAYAIYNEIKGFLAAHDVAAHSIINYRRIVYQNDENRLRVTFDDRLRVFKPIPRLYAEVGALTSGNLGAPITSIANCVMEIKSSGAYPSWLVDALGSRYPRKTSKFTTSIDFIQAHIRCRETPARPADGGEGRRRRAEGGGSGKRPAHPA